VVGVLEVLLEGYLMTPVVVGVAFLVCGAILSDDISQQE